MQPVTPRVASYTAACMVTKTRCCPDLFHARIHLPQTDCCKPSTGPRQCKSHLSSLSPPLRPRHKSSADLSADSCLTKHPVMQLLQRRTRVPVAAMQCNANHQQLQQDHTPTPCPRAPTTSMSSSIPLPATKRLEQHRRAVPMHHRSKHSRAERTLLPGSKLGQHRRAVRSHDHASSSMYATHRLSLFAVFTLCIQEAKARLEARRMTHHGAAASLLQE